MTASVRSPAMNRQSEMRALKTIRHPARSSARTPDSRWHRVKTEPVNDDPAPPKNNRMSRSQPFLIRPMPLILVACLFVLAWSPPPAFPQASTNTSSEIDDLGVARVESHKATLHAGDTVCCASRPGEKKHRTSDR